MSERPTRKVEVTRLLKEWRAGSGEALELLMPLVYDELRRIARVQLARERKPHALQATELVNEAFVRLVDQKAGWQNRLHFYGIAAQCMRRILVDHARRKRAAKRPRIDGAVELEKVEPGQPSNVDTLLALDEALTRLAAVSPRQAKVAELRIFAGLEISDIAKVAGVSEATVKRDWSDAKRLFRVALDWRGRQPAEP
jgi:RNA polymerase sigma-70 factor (ECF subfamily)